MPVCVGIVTARDGFTIAFDKNKLQNRILQFQNIQGLPDDVITQAYNLKGKPGWSLTAARKKVQVDTNALKKIYPILYRPFDMRYIFYHEAVFERPRSEVMRHMLAGENLGLITRRQQLPDRECTYFFVLTKSYQMALFAQITEGVNLFFLSTSTSPPTCPICSTRSKNPTWPNGCCPN